MPPGVAALRLSLGAVLSEPGLGREGLAGSGGDLTGGTEPELQPVDGAASERADYAH